MGAIRVSGSEIGLTMSVPTRAYPEGSTVETEQFLSLRFWRVPTKRPSNLRFVRASNIGRRMAREEFFQLYSKRRQTKVPV